MNKTAAVMQRSISYNEIVTVPFDRNLERELYANCDGSVVNGDLVEFWGGDEDGNDWRVHLKGSREVTDEEIKALKREAAEASDFDQVVLCTQALGEYGEDYLIESTDFSIVSRNFERFDGFDVAEARKQCEQVITQ